MWSNSSEVFVIIILCISTVHKNYSGVTRGVQVVLVHYHEKIAALFWPFSKMPFPMEALFNESNVLTSGV